MIAPLRALTTALLAGSLSAATLTVGPGGAFPQITDAIAAAQPGDVILVEPGNYDGFTLDKPLRILGTGPGVVVSGGPLSTLVVRDIGPGQEVVVAQLELRSSIASIDPLPGASVEDCAGTVTLQGVHAIAGTTFTGLQVVNCDRVLVVDSELWVETLRAGLSSVGSEVWLVNSSIAINWWSQPGADGVSAQGSDLHVWRSTIRGGKALPSIFDHTGGDGLSAEDSTIQLYGGPEGGLFGGEGGDPTTFAPGGAGGAALRLDAGSVARIQATLPLVGGTHVYTVGSAEPIQTDGSGSWSFDPTVFPTLVAGVPFAAVGSSFQLEVTASPASSALAFASLTTGPTLALAGVEGLGLLDPTAFAPLGSTVLDGTGVGTLGVAVPPVPEFLGTVLYLQALEVAGAGLAITNPGVVPVVL